MRLLAAFKHDVVFQFRHGFYYAYLVLTIIYILALMPLKGLLQHTITTLVLITDVGMIGFFFVGAIVILEKGQNLLESVFVTPLRLNEYLLSKVASLALLALLSALVIASSVYGFSVFFLLFIPGMVLGTAFYTLFGIWVAIRSKNVNDYFAKALGLGLFLSLPLIDYLNILKSSLFHLFPANAMLVFFDSLYNPQPLSDILIAFVTLSIWTAGAALLVQRDFKKYIILQMGVK